MVKESKIKELINDKVVSQLEIELSKVGFKYLKSKKYFIRQEREFQQTITVNTPYSPLKYDDNTDQIYLVFNINSNIEIPNYETWFLDKFGGKTYYSERIDSSISQIELSFEDFENENFYTPTASQNFKKSISLSLMEGDSKIVDIESFDTVLQFKIPEMVSNLSINSDILKLDETNKYKFHSIYLLIFGGYVEVAHSKIQEFYKYLILKIESKEKLSENELNSYLEELNVLVKNVSKVTDLTLENPFKQTIKVLNSKNDSFAFSEKTIFQEKLRIDLSQYGIKSIFINLIGDILVVTTNQKIIKLNIKGEIIFETELETPKGFRELSYDFPCGIVENSTDFFINNYILKADNTLLELSIPLQKLKKGALQNATISNLNYWNKKESYLISYENNLYTYNKNGEIEKTVKIEQKRIERIIVEKEWIIALKIDKALVILDFEGKQINEFEFGNGNNRFEFSANYKYLICCFYSTKSQFFDLITDKKETLWAHPTFIKNYKEMMYNDINHNFGMSFAKFSPDNNYIVGSADHGKYVAWKLPKLDRIELIPQEEMIGLLEPAEATRFTNNESETIITKAEIVKLENHTFLKNRGNDISKIMFFENGDIFITEIGIGKFVLTWDRNFNNLAHQKIDGKLDFYAEKYLTQHSKTEFIVYEQK